MHKSLSKQSDHGKKKTNRLPKRLENPIEMLKYLISRTSLHGIKYVQEVQLYKIERIIWLFLVVIAFYAGLKVILELYGKFKVSRYKILYFYCILHS